MEHLSRRIAQVQDTLGRQILIENLSCYLAFSSSRLTEWEFLAAVVERAGCGLLLDVNNAYVNACNVGLDVVAFINGLPPTSDIACITIVDAAPANQLSLAGNRLAPSSYLLTPRLGNLLSD